MSRFDFSNYKLDEADGVFTFKNENTTLGFVRFNDQGEVEYIFVNPIFRKKGIATKLLQLVKQKIGKEIILQEPISPLGSKLLNSLNKWK
jgi:GNAT superfamily N-acetyltransferase